MLKAVVTDLNEVDENLRGFYVEKSGKHVLQVTPVDGFELDDVKGLKSALGAERNLRSGIEDKLKVYEGIDAGTARSAIEKLSLYGDIAPEKAKEALETAARLAALDPTKEAERIAEEKIGVREKALKDQFTARETELTAQLNAKINSLEEVKARREAQVEKLLKDNTIKTELAKANPLDGARYAVELMAAQVVKLRESNGQYVIDVLDENGNPRIKDHLGTPFTVADYLAELREKSPDLFKPDEKKGIGLTTNNQGSGNTPPTGTTQVNPFKRGPGFSMTEQMRLARSNPDLAQRLRAEAATG